MFEFKFKICITKTKPIHFGGGAHPNEQPKPKKRSIGIYNDLEKFQTAIDCKDWPSGKFIPRIEKFISCLWNHLKRNYKHEMFFSLIYSCEPFTISWCFQECIWWYFEKIFNNNMLESKNSKFSFFFKCFLIIL